jgi:hypothetical protein
MRGEGVKRVDIDTFYGEIFLMPHAARRFYKKNMLVGEESVSLSYFQFF